MKVLGLSGQNYDKKYICEVDHEELEKFLGQYYGKMNKLEVGQEVDLGKGYDFARDAKDAFNSLQDVIDKNAKVLKAITDGVSFLGEFIESKKAKK
jgi:hypothetical protein